MSGRYQNPELGETGSFSCLSQLMLKLERCLDINNIPQAFCASRHFSPFISMWDSLPTEVGTCPGKKATFVVQILFRRNSSWQGNLTWLEEEKTQQFRSVLELMDMINGALSAPFHPFRFRQQPELPEAADS